MRLKVFTKAMLTTAVVTLPISASAETTVRVDVPAQGLFAAIEELSNQTGVPIVVSKRFIRGERSTAISGDMTPLNALSAIVNDTKLYVEELADGSLVVAPISRDFVAQDATDEDALDLGTIVLVSDEATAGLFGNKPVKDIPFTVTAFTSDLIERTQARTVGEIADNDASVQSQLSTSANNDFLRIRGFGAAFTVDGLNGLGARFSRPEFYEQVEFFKGPNALLNGVPVFGNIGGIVNFVPKRAKAEDINTIRVSYETGGHTIVSYDLGRKFGSNDQFGIRVNAGVGDGDLVVDDASRQLSFASVALDYDNGGPFRANAFVAYQDVNNEQFQVGYRFANASIPIPIALDNSINENRFETARSTDTNVILGVEYDALPNWTLSARFGYRDQDDPANEGRSNVIQNANGDTTGTFFVGGSTLENTSYELKSVNTFSFSGIDNELVVQATQTELKTRSAFNSATTIDGFNLDGNIYAPPIIPDGLGLSALPRTPSIKAISRNIGFSNRATLLNGDLDVIFGLRYQEFEQTRFFANPVTTINTDAVTGAFGLVYRYTDDLNFYASYSEGLEPGRGSPSFATNRGEITDPIATEQTEIGLKYDNGRWGGSLAAFEINNPQAFVDANTNIFGLNGNTRSRGVEGAIFGEIAEGFRITGSFLYADTIQEQTNAGVNEGFKAPGFPDLQATIYAEYDLPAVPGLTLKARAIYQSATPVDADNSREIPSWERFDLGMRYQFSEASGIPLTIDVDVLNVADTAYWRGTQFTEIYTGQPRTLLVTASVDF